MHGWDGDWHMGGMMLLWSLLGIVFIIAVVWLISRGNGEQRRSRESPEDIVKRRYAGGEIGREEYERTLADLRR